MHNFSFLLATAGAISMAGCSTKPAADSSNPAPPKNENSTHTTATPTNSAPELAPKSSDAAWKAFTPPEAHYSVQLPGAAQAIPSGDPSIKNYGVELPTGSVYLVSESGGSAPIINPAKGLAALRDAVVGNNESLFDKEISIAGETGREFGYIDPDGDVWQVRAFIKNDRVYQLMTMSPKAKHAEAGPEIAKFFESFQLIEGPPVVDKNEQE